MLIFVITGILIIGLFNFQCKGNTNNLYPTLSINIYKIQKIDEIEGPGMGNADWYYVIYVYDGEWNNTPNIYAPANNDNPTVDNIHNFTVHSTQIMFEIKLMESDTGKNDLADISGYVGGGADDNTTSRRGAIYTGYYNLKNNSLWGDPIYQYEDYIVTSGELSPDNSTTSDENDAAVFFKIWDNYEPPHANAGPDKIVYVDNIVNFNASASTASEGSSLIDYKWDFNNDGLFDATGMIASHTYSTVGTYIVRLEVTDSLGEKSSDTCTITVNSPSPVAKFTYYPSKPFTSTTIHFTDLSSGYGKIISWHWNFGDGSTSTIQNPTHKYLDDGKYKVTLAVIDEYGKSNSTYMYVTVKNVAPDADFTFTPSKPSILDTIYFTDTSTDPDGYVVSREWDFGDDYKSTLKNPSHTYVQKKTYTVTLKVWDDDGAYDVISKQITITNIYPIANFTWQPLNPKTNNDINFSFTGNDPDGIIVNYTWNFGDGTISYEQNPRHNYSKSGKYNITLIITDDDGDTDVIVKTISVGEKRIPAFEFVILLLAISITWITRKTKNKR